MLELADRGIFTPDRGAEGLVPFHSALKAAHVIKVGFP